MLFIKVSVLLYTSSKDGVTVKKKLPDHWRFVMMDGGTR